MLEKRADVGKVWVSKGQATRHNTRVHHAALESDSAGRHPPGGGGWAPGSSEDAWRGWRRGRGWLSQAALTSAQSRLRPPRCGAVRPRRTPRRAEGVPAGRAALPAGGSNRRGAVAAEGSDCPAPAALTGLSLPACLPPGEPRASSTGLPSSPPPAPPARAAAGLLKPLTAPTFELIQTRQRRAAPHRTAPPRAAPRRSALPPAARQSSRLPPFSSPLPPRPSTRGGEEFQASPARRAPAPAPLW